MRISVANVGTARLAYVRSQWMPTPTTTDDTVSWDEMHEPGSGGNPGVITNGAEQGQQG